MLRRDSKYNIAVEIINLFFPKICFHCHKNKCNHDDLLCDSCLSLLHELTTDELFFEASEMFEATSFVHGLFSLYKFKKDSAIQTLLHELKYQNKFNIAKYFGQKTGEKFLSQLKSLDIDFVVPVPLHRVKKAERGFNQSLYFAKGISQSVGCKVRDDIIARKIFTQSQTKLNKYEREENVREAFVSLRKISHCNILLADDVITTGSTIKACAKVIKESGAKNIYAASIAIA